MKIVTYSDVHLEFGHDWVPPKGLPGDLMILAGDIVTFKGFESLGRFLKGWGKPVLYVAGNHEYYTNEPMNEGTEAFAEWLATNHSNVKFLRDEEIVLDGVNFFGGTMWTDFNNGDEQAMGVAQRGMNDFVKIRNADGKAFTPFDSVVLHNQYVEKLLAWFAKPLMGPRVVISHHAPVVNPHTQYRGSELMPAFNSLDMIKIIEKHQPDLWIYGHTHECDDQPKGRTRIISNQAGLSPALRRV